MQPKFFWLTDTYRVNIGLIFSLEDKQRDNSIEYDRWYDEYENILDDIKQDENLITEIIKDVQDEPQSIIEETIKQYIFSKIGQEPDKIKHQYYVILENGMKIEISEYKYQLINDIIDKYCI